MLFFSLSFLFPSSFCFFFGLRCFAICLDITHKNYMFEPSREGPLGFFLLFPPPPAREIQMCTFRGPGASKTTKIPRKDPEERNERKNIVAGEGKTARNFGPPTPLQAPPPRGRPSAPSPLRGPALRGPTLRGPPFGPLPFGAPQIGAPPFEAPPFRAPTLGSPTFS